MKNAVVLVLIVAALLLAACSIPAQPAPVPPPPKTPVATEVAPVEQTAAPSATAPVADVEMPAAGIPVEALKNATYGGIYDEVITLTDGRYEGKPFVEGDASHPIVEYINGVELTGDLDGDGVDDAIVFLLERGGGAGAFTYVAAQLNRDGQPVDAGAVRIEDRIGVKAAAVEDGQIALEIITQGPGDAACCGTHRVRKTYALQGGRLVETAPEGGDLARVSAADLDGTNWTLVALSDDRPALPDTEVTLSFRGDPPGVSGSGGCSDYTGSFSLGATNPFTVTVGPLAATRQACPGPIGSQESAYFDALQKAGRWGYAFGKLALYYAGGHDGESRMLFAPAAEADAVAADDYTAVSAISKHGFAIDGEQMRALDGQEVRLWGFVDHGNMYGDEGVRAVLEDWWSGEGPDAATWLFSLKADADDAVGQSFAVTVPNDAGRDALLRQFVADAQAQRPTKVFLTGKIATFDAPTNTGTRTGLTLELRSSADVLLAPPDVN